MQRALRGRSRHHAQHLDTLRQPARRNEARLESSSMLEYCRRKFVPGTLGRPSPRIASMNRKAHNRHAAVILAAVVAVVAAAMIGPQVAAQTAPSSRLDDIVASGRIRSVPPAITSRSPSWTRPRASFPASTSRWRRVSRPRWA
jgi:hypothetical protein